MFTIRTADNENVIWGGDTERYSRPSLGSLLQSSRTKDLGPEVLRVNLCKLD